MTDFLLELLSEEIPARMQAKASEDLARMFTEKLAEAGLKAERLTSYVTPRRLALIAHGLPLQTQAVTEERKGPRADAPAQALEGFLRSTGLTRDQLVERPDNKGNAILFAVIEKPGRATADVIAEIVPQIIRAFPWPKSMRWGQSSQSTTSLRWVRPLQGIIALLGDDVVDFEIDGVRSGSATVGHRFHHPGAITIGNAHDYAEKLRLCHVIVDQKERQQLIEEKAKAAAEAAGLELVEDKGLVAENAGLTEWPIPLLGSFDPAFLEVPPEVIQLTMRTNQKYFAVRYPPRHGEGDHAEHGGGGSPQSGTLAPAFICTANIDAHDGGKAIVAGNQKVLAARLSDARFFWEQDRKTSLVDHAKKLDRIVFHEKLGTVADKVDRVAKLARWLVEEGIVRNSPLPFRGGAGGGDSPDGAALWAPPHPNPSPEGEGLDPSTLSTRVTPAKAGVSGGSAPTVEMPASAGMTKEQLAQLAYDAAKLCKADLVTEMVGEFPELQGLMGGYYARAEGSPEEVANAIRDHYKPVGQGDEVPSDPVTVAVSLADKIDSLVTLIFAVGTPSGSKDPFALRRASISIVRIIVRNCIRASLSAIIDKTAEIALGQFLNSAAEADESFADFYRPRVSAGEHPIRTLHDLIVGDPDSLTSRKAVESITTRLTMNERSRRYIEFARNFALNFTKAPTEILDFSADRLKVQQREAGVRHDLIDAVFALGGEDDLVRLLARVKALQSFIATEDGANLLTGYRRAANILKKEGVVPTSAPAKAGAQGDEVPGQPRLLPSQEHDRAKNPLSYIPEIEEAALIAALDAAEPRAADAVRQEDFEGAMSALASLRAPIDAFFDKVTVNDTNPEKRTARLGLLMRVRNAVHEVADFSRIEG